MIRFDNFRLTSGLYKKFFCVLGLAYQFIHLVQGAFMTSPQSTGTRARVGESRSATVPFRDLSFPQRGIILIVQCAIAALAGLLATAAVRAQDLRYQPINPSFGGNPLYSSHLQGVASAQNKYKDPDAINSQDPAQQFIRSLQSRLYSAVANQISDALFGKNPIDSGQIVFGTQTIDFFRDVNGITLNITDTALGTTTSIVVPTYHGVT
jgi:curli production assembly/transport component CsgF